MNELLLPSLILLPLLAGILLCVFGGRLPGWFTRTSWGVAGLVLFGSLMLLQSIDASPGPARDSGLIAPAIVFAPSWMNLQLPIRIEGHPVEWQLLLGADSISGVLVLLNAIVTLAVLLTAEKQMVRFIPLYAGLILITQGLLNLVFLAMDLLLFYVGFEAVLLPLILLINLWGDSKESLRASRKFLLFTLAGSLPMVVGLVGLILQSASPQSPSTVSLVELSNIAKTAQLDPVLAPIASSENASARTMQIFEAALGLAKSQYVILFTLLLGLGIKMAILPFHSWLPTTYAAAHPNTTALIAGVVSKLGAYGMLRIVLPLTPLAVSYYVQFALGFLGSLAILYGALLALGQTDLRKLFAYASISHMGFITLGIVAMNREGLAGASMHLLNHGLITASIYLLIGMVEARRGRWVLDEESRGLAAAYPRLGVLMVFFILASVGLPGLNSFVGELLAATGILRLSGILCVMAIIGTLFGAWYSLRLIQYVFWGSNGTTVRTIRDASDLRALDLTALVPIAILCLIIGVFPRTVTDRMARDVEHLAARLEPATRIFHPEIDGSLVAVPKP